MGFEIEKLRSRLKNVKKSDSEYRMTVAEAKKLLDEIDSEKKSAVVIKEIIKEQPRTNIIDGGQL
jgi:hypothetical protein